MKLTQNYEIKGFVVEYFKDPFLVHLLPARLPIEILLQSLIETFSKVILSTSWSIYTIMEEVSVVLASAVHILKLERYRED